MSKAVFRTLVVAVALSSIDAAASDGIVIIGNANLHQLDKNTIARIYAGKVIEAQGIAITAVNAASGTASAVANGRVRGASARWAQCTATSSA